MHCPTLAACSVLLLFPFVAPLSFDASMQWQGIRNDWSVWAPPSTSGVWNPSENRTVQNNCNSGQIPVFIRDARVLQATSNLTYAEFFAKHSFVLIHNTSATSCEVNHDEIVSKIFLPEQKAKVLHDGIGIKRGPGYGAVSTGNHQDTSINASGYMHNAALAWNGSHDIEDAISAHVNYHYVNFWGAFDMKEGIMQHPLAIADPHYNDIADVTTSIGVVNGDWQANVQCRNTQRWYYYPHMTNDEILVFTHYQFRKGDGMHTRYMRSTFHGGFDNPITRHGDFEPRKSCERRVAIQLNF